MKKKPLPRFNINLMQNILEIMCMPFVYVLSFSNLFVCESLCFVILTAFFGEKFLFVRTTLCTTVIMMF